LNPHWVIDATPVLYRQNLLKTRRTTLSPFPYKQRPLLCTIRSGCHDLILPIAALALLLCERSGKRIPKKIWPHWWYIPVSHVANRQYASADCGRIPSLA